MNKRNKNILNLKKIWLNTIKNSSIDPRIGTRLYVFMPDKYFTNDVNKAEKILSDLLGKIELEKYNKKQLVYSKSDFDYKTTLFLCFANKYEKIFMKKYISEHKKEEKAKAQTIRFINFLYNNIFIASSYQILKGDYAL